MRELYILAWLAVGTSLAAERPAKSIVLFLGDAGGISTLNAASLYGHDEPQKLFLQHMPHIALSDTSAANTWVTDSAAGMTAIVTGQKTNNGVISQSAQAVRGESDGAPLKTILEYAEEHGLSTGVISNMPMFDATPAACYAHSNDRAKSIEIFSQILTPRFGDGVDLVIGGGRKRIFGATEGADAIPRDGFRKKGYALYDDPAAIPADAKRVIALFDQPFEAAPVVRRAIEILSRNPKGYFLMVEWDMHTTNIKRGLDNALAMDGLIAQTAKQVKNDTLILFTADHSFDLRVRGGRKGENLIPEGNGAAEKKPRLRVEDGHTGEEVLVAAQGPGSERVHGFLRNTDLFRIMMSAYRWPVEGSAKR
jgi:alkaline phosphatase